MREQSCDWSKAMTVCCDIINANIYSLLLNENIESPK